MGCTRDNYDKKHIAPGDEREIALLNSFAPKCCPKCGSVQTIRYGKTNAGLIRFRCKDCGGTFTIITGTIFGQRKISVSQWLDFMVMVIGHGSFNLTSKMNRNAYTTTKYWMKKLFLTFCPTLLNTTETTYELSNEKSCRTNKLSRTDLRF